MEPQVTEKVGGHKPWMASLLGVFQPFQHIYPTYKGQLAFSPTPLWSGTKLCGRSFSTAGMF